MRGSIRVSVLMMATGFLLAIGVAAPSARAAEPDEARLEALHAAMTPGEAHKKLAPMVGIFGVKIRTWLDPSEPPFESDAVATTTWVLGGRYIQTMLSGFVMGEPYFGIGYAGYNNVTEEYMACYMDTGGTGMEWYKGGMAADGKSAKLTATIDDAITGELMPVEMRISVTPDGNHVTELWQADENDEMMKVMELLYMRQEP